MENTALIRNHTSEEEPIVEEMFDPKEKKRLIATIFSTQMVCGILFLNIVIFYPLFVDDNYSANIGPAAVSIVLGSFQFAGVICNPIHSRTISKMGRKNAIIIGTSCMLVGNTGMGLCSLIPYERWGTFYFFSLVLRFLMGYGDTLAVTTMYSLITTTFTEEKSKYIGIMEAAQGLGLMIGPLLGGFLYPLLKYASTFYFFSLLIAINLFIQIKFISPKFNNPESPSNENKTMLVHSGFGAGGVR